MRTQLVLEDGTRNSSIRATYEIRDLGVVQNIAAGPGEGFNEGNVVSRISLFQLKDEPKGAEETAEEAPFGF